MAATAQQLEEILELLSSGQPLRQICRKPGMPSPWAVLRIVEKDEQFAQRYAHARSLGLEVIADEILEISDDGRNDWVEREDGTQQANYEHITRSRLRVDSRKWLLSKMRPDKYGDLLKTEVSGANGGAIEQKTELSIKFVGPQVESIDGKG